MAFRRELFERVGEFDPRRGIVGRKLFRGEESDLIDRALGLGLRIAYDAALTVFHRIGPDRMRKGYFRRLAFDDAQGDARLTPVVGGRSFLGASLSSVPKSLPGIPRVGIPAAAPAARSFRSTTSLAGVGRKAYGLLESASGELDLRSCRTRLPDIPVHSGAKSVAYQEDIARLKAAPTHTMIARLVAFDESGAERVVGEYTFHHTRTLPG